VVAAVPNHGTILLSLTLRAEVVDQTVISVPAESKAVEYFVSDRQSQHHFSTSSERKDVHKLDLRFSRAHLFCSVHPRSVEVSIQQFADHHLSTAQTAARQSSTFYG
jgi:hypothetical protein